MESSVGPHELLAPPFLLAAEDATQDSLLTLEVLSLQNRGLQISPSDRRAVSSPVCFQDDSIAELPIFTHSGKRRGAHGCRWAPDFSREVRGGGGEVPSSLLTPSPTLHLQSLEVRQLLVMFPDTRDELGILI